MNSNDNDTHTGNWKDIEDNWIQRKNDTIIFNEITIPVNLNIGFRFAGVSHIQLYIFRIDKQSETVVIDMENMTSWNWELVNNLWDILIDERIGFDHWFYTRLW